MRPVYIVVYSRLVCKECLFHLNPLLQKGYDDLQSIVPTCQQQSEFAMAAQKISKATVLQKSKSLSHSNRKRLHTKVDQIAVKESGDEEI